MYAAYVTRIKNLRKHTNTAKNIFSGTCIDFSAANVLAIR